MSDKIKALWSVLGFALLVGLGLFLRDCDGRMRADNQFQIKTCATACGGGYVFQNYNCLCLQDKKATP